MVFNKMYNLFFAKLFCFKGRSGKKEYSARILLTFFIFFISPYINNWKEEQYHLSLVCGWILVICLLISLIQYFPLAVRRLHDIGYSGWWFLVFSVACPITILILMFTPGMEEANKYGEPPTD